MNHSDYLKILNPRFRADVVKHCFYRLIELGWEFDAIAVTGLSGSLVGVELATILDKNIMIVRKSNNDSHGKLVESTQPFRDGVRYIIVDDFICGGSTVKRLYREIRKEYTQKNWVKDTERNKECPTYDPPVCVGVLLHASQDHETDFDVREYDYDKHELSGPPIPALQVRGIIPSDNEETTD